MGETTIKIAFTALFFRLGAANCSVDHLVLGVEGLVHPFSTKSQNFSSKDFKNATIFTFQYSFLFLSKDGGILIWPYRQPGTHFGAMVAKDQTRG